MAAAAPKETEQLKLTGTRELVAPMNTLRLREQNNLDWRLVARDATEEHLKQPVFWSVIQEKLKSFDRVAVITMEYFFDVLMLYVESGCPVQVAILAKIPLPIVHEKEHGRIPAGYFIDFDPSEQRYTARRLSDNHPLTAPHARWDDAYRELVSHAIFRTR